MIVKDIMDIAEFKLHNLNVTSFKNVFINFINLGINELYDRFNLSLKNETIEINYHTSMYELKNSNVNMLLGVYSSDGVELNQVDTKNNPQEEIKIINYKTFLLRNPFDGFVYAVYKASPIMLKDEDDIIDLPKSMVNALLEYITYISNTTINKDNGVEADINYKRFEVSCQRLENQGYRVEIFTEKQSLFDKGFI